MAAASARSDALLLQALRTVSQQKLLDLPSHFAILCAAVDNERVSPQLLLYVCRIIRAESRRHESDAVVMRTLVECGSLHALQRALSLSLASGLSSEGTRQEAAPSADVCLKLQIEALAACANIAGGAWSGAKVLIARPTHAPSLVAAVHAVRAATGRYRVYVQDVRKGDGQRAWKHGLEAAVQGLRFMGNACYGMADVGAQACTQVVLTTQALGAVSALLRVLAEEAGRQAACSSVAVSLARWSFHCLGNLAYGLAPNAVQDDLLLLEEGGGEGAAHVAQAGSASMPAQGGSDRPLSDTVSLLAVSGTLEPRVAAFGCECIGNMAFRHPRCAGVLVREGALQTVARMMQLHAHAAAVQGQGTFALAALLSALDAASAEVGVDSEVLDSVRGVVAAAVRSAQLATDSMQKATPPSGVHSAGPPTLIPSTTTVVMEADESFTARIGVKEGKGWKLVLKWAKHVPGGVVRQESTPCQL